MIVVVVVAVLLVGVAILGIIAAIAIPNLLAARRAANEASAIHSLRTIAGAQSTYQNVFRKFGTLEELAANNLLDPNLSRGEKNGYLFVVVANPDTFEVNAVPTVYRSSGLRSFYIDESAVIRAGDNYGGPSSKHDEPLEASYEYPHKANRRVDYRRDGNY